MGTFAIGLQVLVAAVFVTAGVAKLANRSGSQQALVGFGMPAALAPALAVALPLAEIATAVALVLRPSARWGAAAAVVLLLLFIAGISRAVTQGKAPDCHCFGQIHSAPAGRATLIRNAVLAGLAIVLVIHGPGPAIDGWIRGHNAAVPVAAVLGAGLVILVAFYWRLWVERRDLARELEQLRKATAALPPGLPVGTPAPGFELPDLNGERVSLAQLRERGLPVVLTFVLPGCPGCQLLFPDLGRWQRSLADRITIAIVSHGSARDNQVAADRFGLVDVLLDEDGDVTSAYRISVSPSGVLVSAAGEIASEPAVSDPTIAPLIRLAMHAPAPRPAGRLQVIPAASTAQIVARSGLESASR